MISVLSKMDARLYFRVLDYTTYLCPAMFQGYLLTLFSECGLMQPPSLSDLSSAAVFQYLMRHPLRKLLSKKK